MNDMSNVRRFMGLFKGYSQAYGTYNPSSLGGEGKQQPTYCTVKQPASEQHFHDHVYGLHPSFTSR